MEIYIKGGLPIDGTGGEPISDPVIVVESGKIKKCGNQNSIRIPKDAAVIDRKSEI